MFATRYKENITIIKYGLIVLNILIMISAIRAIVNHQNITDSISDVKLEVIDTQQHTDYINNFLAPYLKSDYAPYFFAHENNQIFPWEKIISIVTVTSEFQNNTWWIGENLWEILSWAWWNNSTLPPEKRNSYLKSLWSSIQWWYENFL